MEEVSHEAMVPPIPFCEPWLGTDELAAIRDVLDSGRLAGDGAVSRRCENWLREQTGCQRAFLTHSCAGALEMAAILAGVGPGDEVLMPSFTFVSTANAFVLRGATPVFVDIREDTLNLDERILAEAITERTRAIVPVHYGGVGCEMQPILDLAEDHGLTVIEDAAQAIGASRAGRTLGAMGHLGTLSFHASKNVVAGEGGALLVNVPEMVARAEIIREKGTDRTSFLRGDVDKYTWRDVGSSFLPSDVTAALLWAQLEKTNAIQERRLALWGRYHDAFEGLERAGKVRRPRIPDDAKHNAHLYYLLRDSFEERERLRLALRARGVGAVFHYVPLHSSPAGRRFGRCHGGLDVTDRTAAGLLRLPLFPHLTEPQLRRVIDGVHGALGG